MHIHRAGLDINVRAPDRVQQLLTREDAPRMLHEIVEQAELGRSEMNVLTIARNLVGHAINLDVAHRDPVIFQARTNPAQHGADTRHQLSR